MKQEVRVYNTLTQEKEVFVPREPGRVSIYVCGVTPYSDTHLGHARPSVVWDVIVRFFQWLGYEPCLCRTSLTWTTRSFKGPSVKGYPPWRFPSATLLSIWRAWTPWE